MPTDLGCGDLVCIDDQLLEGVIGGVQYPGDNPHGSMRASPESFAARSQRVDDPAGSRQRGADRANARLMREYGQ
jgi:hypothetical protein